MTSCDKRLEELLNRAGQTISDLPKNFPGGPEAYGEKTWKTALTSAWCWYLPLVYSPGDTVSEIMGTRNSVVLAQYILHLTDIIDRMEWALKNLLNIYDRQTHIIANVDAPEGLTQEQYFKAVEAIIEALDKYRAGLEPWDDWGFEDAKEV